MVPSPRYVFCPVKYASSVLNDMNLIERLIHLELADLSAYEPYLETGWKCFEGGDILHNRKNKTKSTRPDTQRSDSSKKDSASISASSKKPAAAAMGKGKPCPDCESTNDAS